MRMSKEKIDVLIEGGKASPAPPLGPALGPLGVDIQKVVDEINERTKELAGMQVPVTVIVDTNAKTFEIKVGTPPASALIKKELGLDLGSNKPGAVRVADMTMEQAKKIAIAKFGSDDERFVNQVIGTARSMGITIGKGPITPEEQKEIEKMRKEASQKVTIEGAAAETEEKTNA